jgi:hypothetical protein
MISPSGLSNIDIRNEFPRLSNLGNSPFGKGADICGDTLDEVIQDAARSRNHLFNLQTIQELQKPLSFTDEQIDRISHTGVLLAIDPTADDTGSTLEGRCPTYRAFWDAVLRAFENDPEMMKHRSA